MKVQLPIESFKRLFGPFTATLMEDVHVTCDENLFRAAAVDPSHTWMIESLLGPDSFTDFQEGSRRDHWLPDVFFRDIYPAVVAAVKDDAMLYFGDQLHISSSRYSVECPIIDVGPSPKIPKIGTSIRLVIAREEITRILKALLKTHGKGKSSADVNMRFEATEGQISVTITGLAEKTMSAKSRILIGPCEGDGRGTYALDFFPLIIEAMPAGPIEISFAPDMPMYIKAEGVTAVLAPRGEE